MKNASGCMLVLGVSVTFTLPFTGVHVVLVSVPFSGPGGALRWPVVTRGREAHVEVTAEHRLLDPLGDRIDRRLAVGPPTAAQEDERGENQMLALHSRSFAMGPPDLTERLPQRASASTSLRRNPFGYARRYASAAAFIATVSPAAWSARMRM